MRRLKRGLCKTCSKRLKVDGSGNLPKFCPAHRFSKERMVAHAAGNPDPEPVEWVCNTPKCDNPCMSDTAKLCKNCADEAQRDRGRMRRGASVPSLKGVPRTPEVRAKLAAAQTGKKLSAATKARCAELCRLGVTGRKRSLKNQFMCRRGRVFNFRSSWEAATARWLDTTRQVWDYEPQIIRLKNGDCYLPDFRLADGSFIEVKGYMDSRDRNRIRRARGLGYVIKVFDERVMKRLGLLPSKR